MLMMDLRPLELKMNAITILEALMIRRPSLDRTPPQSKWEFRHPSLFQSMFFGLC